MAQKINVDTTPGLLMPTLYYSQGDIGRVFEINLSSKDGFTIPAGATVKMVATKPSGFGFEVTGTLTGSVASFTTTETMTNEAGRYPAEIRIESSGDVIGTANFMLSGEINPHPDGTVDGDAEEIIPELTLLVERAETAAELLIDCSATAVTLAAGSDATASYSDGVFEFGIPKGADGSLSSNVLAPTYSSSATYAVGDYVYYSGSLYRCTTAITTAEAWTAAHWTSVALGNDVTDLKSALSETTRNIFDKFVSSNILSGYYIDGTGNVASNASTAMVICPCAGDTQYTISKMVTEHFRVATYASKPAYQSHALTTPTTNDSAKAITITTGSTATWLGIYVYNSNHDTGVTLQQIVDTIQVELGATATDYIPHITAKDFVARGATEELTPKVEDIETNLTVLTDKSIVYGQNIANPALFGEKGTWYYQGEKYTSGSTYTDNSIAFIFEPIVGETYYIGRYNSSDGEPVSNTNYALYLSAWDEDGNYLSYDVEQNVSEFTAKEHTAKVALTLMLYSGASQVANAYVSTTACPASFVPYSEYDMHSAKADIDALKEGGVALNINLPSTLYAVIGEELNIYFDNIINADASEYHVNVDCSVGEQLERCYRITPTTVGQYPITISYEKNGAVLQKSATLKVLNADTTTEQTIKVLVIGDSTTNGGVAVHKLMDDASGKRIAVSLLGTRGDAPYLHEGRSGWTANYYVNVQSDGTYTNAFYNPSTQTFDFSYYLSNNNIDDPNLVIINLGINDVFNPTNDDDLATAINTYLACVEDMIDSIQSAVPTAKIGIAITIPPNYSQDSFGKAYGCGQSRARYKVNNNELGKSIINTFTGRTSENLYVIPIHTNLDTKYNMATEQTQVNSRNEETYTSPTGYASVHPATSGLWQVADIYWYTLTAIFTNSY